MRDCYFNAFFVSFQNCAMTSQRCDWFVEGHSVTERGGHLELWRSTCALSAFVRDNTTGELRRRGAALVAWRE